MEVKIKTNKGFVEATVEMIDGMMVVSPKEEKFEPKDGDVVSTLSGTQIFICKEYIGDNLVDVYFGLDFEKNEFFDSDKWIATRFATEEEKNLLFDKLNQEGYEWDAEKKELRKKEWKPKYPNEYYFPFADMFKFEIRISYW